MTPPQPRNFWRDVFAVQGSATPHVGWQVLAFGVLAAVVLAAHRAYEEETGQRLSLEVAPYEVAGAALGLLLILRTNAGNERWWEARKLWGSIVNQCRNLVSAALAYGPADPAWRGLVVRWTAAFPHVARRSLRGEPPGPEVAALVGPEATARLAAAGHMPSAVALKLAELLRDGCERLGMDRFAFLEADRERAALIDHIGGCERILKTPLPLAYSIMIRQFIALFLLALPLALLHKVESDWLVPFITMAVAYPLLALDQIGSELQNPFSTKNPGHLPLDDISALIEQDLYGPGEGSRSVRARAGCPRRGGAGGARGRAAALTLPSDPGARGGFGKPAARPSKPHNSFFRCPAENRKPAPQIRYPGRRLPILASPRGRYPLCPFPTRGEVDALSLHDHHLSWCHRSR